MKKIIISILMTTLLFSLFTGVGAASTNATKTTNSNVLRLSAMPCPENVELLALQHLIEMKEKLSVNPEALGFSDLELSKLQIGNSFSIYVFDKDLCIISNDVYVFPLLYKNNIIGVMEVKYDTTTDSYCFTFGKSYGNELNNLKKKYTCAEDSGLIIGRIGDKLFATDGNKATILLDKKVDGSPTVTIDQINSLFKDSVTKVSSYYVTSTDAVDREMMSSDNDSKSASQSALTKSYPNPLPVPHVAQTGVCGVAAWAAVLNYRFGTSHTNSTLDTAMQNGGYYNGSSGIPNMDDYKNYANDTHNAGCVRKGKPSFSTLRSKINAGRPIMGSWYSGSGSDKKWHATIITGYIENTSSHTYYLKNPWYNYAQTITVTDSNSVVYSDSGYTWKLSTTVY